jgi:CheY-like chemotaxis protein
MTQQADIATVQQAQSPRKIRQLRQSKRCGLSMTVNLVVDGVVSTLTLENVSATGMGLHGWPHFETGSLVSSRDVQIQLPDSRVLAVQVCWAGKGRIGVQLVQRLRQDDPLLLRSASVEAQGPRHTKPLERLARVPFRGETAQQLFGRGIGREINKSILVADPFRSVGLLIKGILEKAGNTVDVVDNGLALVEAARSRPYDVVLIDSQISLLGGSSAVTRIRQLPAPFGGCSIIALSTDAVGRQFGTAGVVADGVLTKPIRPAALLEQVAAVRAARALEAMTTLTARVANAA